MGLHQTYQSCFKVSSLYIFSTKLFLIGDNYWGHLCVLFVVDKSLIILDLSFFVQCIKQCGHLASFQVSNKAGEKERSAKLKASSCQLSPATHCPRPMWQIWLQGASFQIGGGGSGRACRQGRGR